MLAQSELLEEDKYAETRPDGSVQSVAYQKDNGSMDDEQAMEMDKLVTHISEQWTINRNDRVYVEQQMLAMQEAVNGEYDSETLAAINAQGGSSIFIPLTSMQCNAGASWLISVLTPPGDKAWSLKSTPVPELPTSLKDKISANVKATIQKQAAPQEAGGPPGSPPPSGGPQGQPPALPKGPQGQPIGPKEVGKIADMEAEQLHKNFKKESILRAENMEGMIDDQLIASGWYQTLEDFVIDLVTFPTAFIKTTYEYSTKLSTNVVDGQFTMTSEEELIAKDERVSPFDMYPSPDQNTIDDGSLIERLKMSRNEIYKCLDKPGYSNENILKVLEEVDGSGFASWQSSVDSQRRYSENHATDFSGQDGSVYGLRFLGFVSIEKLLDWGYSVETLQEQGLITEPLDEYGEPSQRDKWREIDIDAILVGTHVIKAVPNMDPEGKRPYYMASYRKVPGSFWGKSAAMLATPHQRLVNATARALSNNMGISSGPQIVVYTDRLPNGESLQSIRPLKIWQMTSDPAGSNSKPIDFFQPESNAQELMAVYQYYFDSVGDVTGIPKQSYSSDPTRAQQGAQTASGLAMLLETASKQIKKAVMNIDSGVIEPRLKYQYQINMMNPEVDNRYKGDMHIKAIGAKSIVAKAVENQRSMELLQATANPIDQAVLGEDGRAALLRTIMRNYDMVDIAPTSEEMEARKEQQSKQPSPPSPEETKLKIEEMRSETRLKDQEMESQLATQQQETDLAIANIELQKKEMDMQIAITNNKDNNETKLKNTALKETNENTRFELEANIKANSPSGTGL